MLNLVSSTVLDRRLGQTNVLLCRLVACLILRGSFWAPSGYLHLAQPLCSYFPFDTLEATTAFPDRFAPPDEGSTSNGLLASAFSKLTMRSGGNSNNANKPAAEPQSDHFTIGRWDQPESGKPEDTINLASALQYSQSA